MSRMILLRHMLLCHLRHLKTSSTLSAGSSISRGGTWWLRKWTEFEQRARICTQSHCGYRTLLSSPYQAPGSLSRIASNQTSLTTQQNRWHGSSSKDDEGTEKVTITFVTRDKKEVPVTASVGKTVLEVAHDNEIELEGACEGSLACSTCHVYVDQKHYDTLEEPCDDENDMLDLAFGLAENSRLGCQIKLTKGLDGMKVTLPAATRNMAVDGYVPKPH